MRTSMPMNVEDFYFLKEGQPVAENAHLSDRTNRKDINPAANRGSGNGIGNLRFIGLLRQYGDAVNLTHNQLEHQNLVNKLRIKANENDAMGQEEASKKELTVTVADKVPSFYYNDLQAYMTKKKRVLVAKGGRNKGSTSGVKIKKELDDLQSGDI